MTNRASRDERGRFPTTGSDSSRSVPQSGARPYGTYFLGRYRVVDEIGVGGMASVHLARMDGPGGFQKWVAIKRIHPHLVEDDSFIQSFLDEARIAARISHANVAQVFDLGKDENTYWIAMEYLHGEPLRELMRRAEDGHAPMSSELASRIIADAAEGLHAAHELRDKDGQLLQLVHRDVTPHNLFLTYDGMVKVVDFGIAKIAGRQQSTRAGTLKGKIAYMSPEQVRGVEVDRRTDVFALGVVLWELTTGRRLFRMETDLDTLERVQACIVPPPSSLVQAYPTELESIVMRALARKREERFQTARDLSRALQAFLVHRGVFVGPEEIASYVKSVFADRVAKREQHLRWAAEVTQTISLDHLRTEGDAPGTTAEELSLVSYASDSNVHAAPRPSAPRPAAGLPATTSTFITETDEATRALPISELKPRSGPGPAPRPPAAGTAPAPRAPTPPTPPVRPPAPSAPATRAPTPPPAPVRPAAPAPAASAPLPSFQDGSFQPSVSLVDDEEEIQTVVARPAEHGPSLSQPAAPAPSMTPPVVLAPDLGGAVAARPPMASHPGSAPMFGAPGPGMAPPAGPYLPAQSPSASSITPHLPRPKADGGWSPREKQLVVALGGLTVVALAGIIALLLTRSKGDSGASTMPEPTSSAELAATAAPTPSATAAPAPTASATASAPTPAPPAVATVAAKGVSPDSLPLATPTPTAAAAAPDNRPTPSPAPVETAAKPAPAETAAKEKEAPAAGGPGFLTVVCVPFCESVRDGSRSLGPSPVVHVPLSPGEHRISLKKTGVPTKVISVVIVSGQVTSRREKME